MRSYPQTAELLDEVNSIKFFSNLHAEEIDHLGTTNEEMDKYNIAQNQNRQYFVQTYTKHKDMKK